ncbi:MAG: immunoglobulin-like domain-containing protein [Bacteroidia bacterium]
MKQSGRKSFLRMLAFAVVCTLSLPQWVVGQSTTPPAGYCTTSHPNMSNNGCQSNYGFNFLKVGLDAWTHNVQCNTSTVYRYWNNMGNIATLSQGGTYTMMCQTQSTSYPTSGAAWVDWDGDGNFSTSEYIGSNSTGTNAPTFYQSFTVPCNAKPGQTIIRFRCDYYSALGSNRGCGTTNNNYGETMDYIITIAGSANPTANFSIPDTVYQNSPAFFVNANQVGYVSHEWDIIGQGSNPDATTVNYTGIFSNTGTYQMKLSSANCQGTATVTKSFDVVAPTSSPLANFVASQNSVVYDGTNPIYIDLYDLTLYGPTSWEWIMDPDYLNGAPFIWLSNNFDQNPSAFFYDVETYDVCLVVSNSMGYDTLCRYAYLEITPPTSGSTFINVLGQNAGSNLDSGYIYDSGGDANPYSTNEFYQFIIEPCGASSVTLNFDMFNLGSGDVLQVFNGNTNSAPSLGSFSGTSLPASVTGTSGSLFLEWTSNASVTGPGFKAHWVATVANNGAPVADFIVPDTVYACSAGNDVEFVNNSSGVVAGQASYDWIFDYDPNVSYPTGYADVADEESPIWPYFANGSYMVRMVLKSCEGNDTVVKSFVIDNTSSLPIVDFTTTERILKVNGTSTFKASAVAACDFEWEITPTTYSLENGGTLTDPEITVKFLAAGSYSIKLIANNDNGSSYKERTNHIEVIQHCTPAVLYPTVADVGIVNFEFESIMNETESGKSPGYTDYTSKFGTTVTIGQTYSYLVERSSTVNNVNLKIWVDYNRDGDFADANETVASVVNSSAGSFTGTFTIPGIQDLIPGETRIRIGMGLANTTLTACGPNQVGEYEDYALFVELDELAPVITLTGSDAVIEKNSTYTDLGATAFDNIEGDITARIVTDINIDVTQAGVYFVTYNVTDLSGNAAVEVVRKVQVVEDLTNPSIVLTGANPLLWSVLVPYVDPGFVATDMPSGATITGLVQVSNPVNVNMIGDYTVTYTVMDAYGNETTVTRTVQVRDTTAPVIVANPTMPVQVGTAFVNPVTASDNFDQNVTPVLVSGTVNSMVIGDYNVTYSVVDASGNVGLNQTITFEVDDYIAPTIKHTPGTETVFVRVFNTNWENAPGMAVTVTDNYYPTAQLTKTLPAGFDINKLGTYVITYQATDKSGNVSTFERTIVVIDDEKPVILTTTLMLPRWSSYDLMLGVVVADNYNQPTDFVNNVNGCEVEIVRTNIDFNYPGIYQVTYVATDESGNRSEETIRLVQIKEEGTSTGIEAVDVNKAVSVYPNPNQGQFTIKLDAELGVNGADVVILDMLGHVVFTSGAESFNNGELAVDLAHLSSGVYLVQVNTAMGSTNKRVAIK